MVLRPVLSLRHLSVNMDHYRLLMLLTTYFINFRLSHQQSSCLGPAAAVGNRCRFDGATTCCVGQATCGATSNLCECPLGKAGPLCDQVCPLNSDGTACETNCGDNVCHQDSRCIQTNSLCICNPQSEGHNCESCIVGFKGTYCDIACPVASNGMTCESDCNRNPCSDYGSCNQNPDGCQCRKGSKGINCEITCPISATKQTCEISCIDNYCHTTGTCRETSTGCQCHASHYDWTCDRTCLIAGTTGLDCTISCPLTSDLRACEPDCTNNPCYDTNTCVQTSAACHCKPGYKGQNCNLCSPQEVQGECREFCEFDGYPCESGSNCDITTGRCECSDGSSGPTCQYCHDNHPFNCLQFCEEDCYGSHLICNTRTKSCECATGFSGTDCAECNPDAHPTGCRDFCPQSCDSGIMCNIKSGECSCSRGYSGSSCEYCYPMQHSHQCREYCEHNGYACAAGSSCLTTLGNCVCPQGQKGQTCQYCSSSSHHLECKNFCPSGCYGRFQICNTRTSQCECFGEYAGANCEMCDPKYHARQCLDFCQEVCAAGTFCDTNTGECTCQDGYLGAGCEYCRPSLNPQRCTRHCAYSCEQGDCYVPTGECRCYEGYSGSDCSFCHPQESNNYCRSHCDIECQNGGACDVYDGTCYCVDTKYSGIDCSLCNKTLVEDGPCSRVCGKECLNGGLCNTSSSVCECAIGYVLGDCSWCDPQEDSNRCLHHCNEVECLHAGHCDTLTHTCVCQENYTGSDCGLCIPRLHSNGCRDYCGVDCKNSATCDTRSGSCICPPGYNGTDCSEECVECRLPICDPTTQTCAGVTQIPIVSKGNSGQTGDPQAVEKKRGHILLIGVSSAVAAILILIIIILLASVWCRGHKKERPSPAQVAGDHVPMIDGQNHGQQKCDNTYSQANILMATRSISHMTDDEYDAVCNSENDVRDSQDLYTYASTQEVHGKLSDSGNYSDANSQIYAYASPDQLSSPNTTPEPYNSLDFSRKPLKPQLPVEVDAQYNRLDIGTPSTQSGLGSNPGGVKINRIKSNMYEDPADLVPDKPAPTAGAMPQYAQVNKMKRGGESSGGISRKRPGTMTLKEDPVEEDALTSPRYTVVEPDMSDTDSEDNVLGQTGEASRLYAEACHELENSTLQDSDQSPTKTRMPPYAKVNKNKKSNRARQHGDGGVYDKLQRPLTTQFTIDDNDDAESDQIGEYSHLIANPQLRRGYSKLDYGSPHVNSSKPQLMSANTYAELQVSPE